MMPMPMIIRGKFDTIVTIISSVLICDADSSSMVAVCRGRKEGEREREIENCQFASHLYHMLV